MQKIVLAYSGSPGSSAAIAWLAEQDGAEVVTVTLDVGQGRELEEVRARALATGAARAHVIDVREEFARRSVLAALQSGAPDVRVAGAGALASLLAKQLADIAEIEDATVVPMPASVTETTSLPRAESRGRADRTLWGRVIECASPGHASSAPAGGLFQLTRDRTQTPDTPAHVELEFDRGVPVRINGVDMPLIELLQSLETIAGTHGVGRTDVTRADADGTMRRTITETPAARALDAALDELRRTGVSVELGPLPAIRLQFLKGDCRVVGHRAATVPTPIAPPVAAAPSRPAEPALTS